MLQERILKLLDAEQLSSSKFADAIGVQRSSISHILSGRNKPSFDFLQKTLRVFPYLNADWLILGEGKMYDRDEVSMGGNLFDQVPVIGDNDVIETKSSSLSESEISPSEQPPKDSSADHTAKDDSQREEVLASDTNLASPLKTISRVIVFYEDMSFDSYER